MKFNTDFLLQRRTIRKYTAQDVPDEILDEIIADGCRTSTTGNMQVYSIIVTRDSSLKQQLLPLHFNQGMVTGAPVVLTFCADFNRFNKWCLLNNASPGYDNFLSFITAATDALLAAQTICVSAEARGLGICYLGTTTYTANKIIEVLRIPRGVVPVTTVTLGWPAEHPEQPDRLPADAIIHREVYSDYTDQEIRDYYSAKEAREDSARFVRENNKATLAQVFTDVRYKKADNVNFSRILLQVLNDQGFMNQ